MSIQELTHAYHKARGTNPEGRPTGRKFMEEAVELLEAIAVNSVNDSFESRQEILYEIGDVANTLSYIAEWYGFTIEVAIKAKTVKDEGRGKAKNGF